MKENRYTMPQQFIEDKNVALKWKLYAYLNGFWISGKTVYATNDHLRRQFQCSERAIQSALKELEHIDLITRDIKGLSRYILPGGIKGRSPASPPHEAQLHQGDEAQLHHISDSISDNKLLGVAFAPRFSGEGEEPAREKQKADPNTERTFRYWQAKCDEAVGQRASATKPSMLKVIKEAHQHLTYPQMKEKIDEWFDEDMADHEKIQIRRCFSRFQIDKFKSESV